MAKINEEMVKELEAKGLKRWTKNGMDRLYANPNVYGVEFDYYKSGNIRYASINGDAVSNAEGRRFKATKAYIDIEDGSVHVRTATDYESEIRKALESMLLEIA